MDHCEQCGQPLGPGRYCTNCGHPVGARDATTTRTAVLSPAVVPDGEQLPRHRQPGAAGTPGWLPWLVGFTVMALVAGLGALLLFGGGEDSPGLLSTEPATDVTTEAAPPSASPTPEPSAATTTEPESTQPPRSKPADLADLATVSAPTPAPASRDTGGQPVSYAAGNLLDHVPTTCWRMPGDGTGEAITFTFDEPVELSRVGLINGYAKVVPDDGGTLDWYRGNRRVQQVEWTFDDGRTVTQDLRETTDMQARPVDQVVTRTITLRLVAVSSPGTGRAARDYTAISDVRLLGTPT